MEKVIYHPFISLDKLLELTLAGENPLNIDELETYDFIHGLRREGYSYACPGCTHLDKEGRCAGHQNSMV